MACLSSHHGLTSLAVRNPVEGWSYPRINGRGVFAKLRIKGRGKFAKLRINGRANRPNGLSKQGFQGCSCSYLYI